MSYYFLKGLSGAWPIECAIEGCVRSFISQVFSKYLSCTRQNSLCLGLSLSKISSCLHGVYILVVGKEFRMVVGTRKSPLA